MKNGTATFDIPQPAGAPAKVIPPDPSHIFLDRARRPAALKRMPS